VTIKQRLPYNEPTVKEKGELSMPRPEQKHLKRYGIVDLRPLKVNSRLGFKYFTGKHPSSKKQVFVKTDPTSGQAAAREGAVLKILNAQTHRAHFPRLVVHEPHGHFAFIATEFIPGDTLNTFLAQHPSLPASQGSLLLSQLALILKILQQNSIIHRDIRPENLMVRLKMDKPLLVLIDFSFTVGLPPNPLPELPFLLARPKQLQRLGSRYRAAADHWDDAYSLHQIAQEVAGNYKCKYPQIWQSLNGSIGGLTFPCPDP
jgi:serine/threonine protein kinase